VSRKLVSTMPSAIVWGKTCDCNSLRTIDEIQAALEGARLTACDPRGRKLLREPDVLSELNLEWQSDKVYVTKGDRVRHNGRPCTVIGPLPLIHHGDWEVEFFNHDTLRLDKTLFKHLTFNGKQVDGYR